MYVTQLCMSLYPEERSTSIRQQSLGRHYIRRVSCQINWWLTDNTHKHVNCVLWLNAEGRILRIELSRTKIIYVHEVIEVNAEIFQKSHRQYFEPVFAFENFTVKILKDALLAR